MCEVSGGKIIILDRDGVINEDSEDYIKSADEFRCYPASIRAIARLCAAGWRAVVVSNQSGIGRGLFAEQDLFAMHAKLEKQLGDSGAALAGIFYCPHTPEDGCDCRKPGTGLLARAERSLGVDLKGSHFVGDRLSDLRAARNYDCVPVLVRTGKGLVTEDAISETGEWSGVSVYDDLAAVVDELLRGRTGRHGEGQRAVAD